MGLAGRGAMMRAKAARGSRWESRARQAFSSIRIEAYTVSYNCKLEVTKGRLEVDLWSPKCFLEYAS